MIKLYLKLINKFYIIEQTPWEDLFFKGDIDEEISLGADDILFGQATSTKNQ